MRYLLGWTLAVLMLSDCGNMNAPSQSSEILRISPDVPALKTGETQPFMAFLMSGATERAVNAQWSSSDAAIAAVDDQGRVSARSPGEASVIAKYAGQNAAQRLAVVPDLSGRWIGQFVIKECSQISGPPPSPCRFVLNGSHPISLAIVQKHADASCQLDLSEPGSTVGGPLYGTARTDAALLIPDQDLTESDVQVRITDWHSAVELSSRSMTGTFNLRAGNASIFGAQVLVYGCEFRAAREQ